MKAWAERFAPERCPACGLTGHDALKAEQTIAALIEPTVWRHGTCGHVLAYRSGGNGATQASASSYPQPATTE